MQNNLIFTIDYDYMEKQNGTSKKELFDNFQELFNKLNNCFKKDNENFAELCFVVYQLEKLFDSYTYKRVYFERSENFNTSINDGYSLHDIMQGFGLEDTQVSRILSCFKKFITIIEDIAYIKQPFEKFSKSKLFELLLVDNKQLELDIQNKVLRPDMSVSSIRKYVKNYKALQNIFSASKQQEQKEEINENDIPMVYNPKQHYEFSYFEDKTKAQLLNIVWDLQKEYERLKEKKNNP